MREPVLPNKSDLDEFLGGFFIIDFSAGSIPKAKAGSESVTRLINKIWVGSRNIEFGIKSDVIKIPITSTKFVEIKKTIVFVMFW